MVLNGVASNSLHHTLDECRTDKIKYIISEGLLQENNITFEIFSHMMLTMTL